MTGAPAVSGLIVVALWARKIVPVVPDGVTPEVWSTLGSGAPVVPLEFIDSTK